MIMGEKQGDKSDLDKELNNEQNKQNEGILAFNWLIKPETYHWFSICLPSNPTKIRLTAERNCNSIFR